MKTLYKILLFAVMPFILCVSCSNEDEQAEENVEGINVKEAVNDTIFIDKGDTLQVTVETQPVNKTVWFYSSDVNVFSVTKEGLISTANKGGIASLLVTAPNGTTWTKKSYVLAVLEYVEAITINNANSTIELSPEQVFDPSGYFTVTPSTATNIKLTYVSDDPSIVSVNSDGKLVAVKKGTTKIAAKSTDGTNIVSEKIEVKVLSVLNKDGWSAVAEYSHESFPPSSLIDGYSGTFWSNPWEGEGFKVPCWVILDMKQVNKFDKIGLVQGLYVQAKDVDIYISKSNVDDISYDDSSFELIGSIEVGDMAEVESVLDFYPTEEKEARYIKLNFVSSRSTWGGDYISLGEVNVYSQK